MVRNYKRKVEGRAYKNWTKDQLNSALREITEEKKSIRSVSAKYGIHRNTLWNKVKGIGTSNQGGRWAFSEEEEKILIAHLTMIAALGSPVTSFDIRKIAKSYLDGVGRNDRRFKDNLPGNDWVDSFIKRHRQEITQINDQVQLSACASLDEDMINSYFDNLVASVGDVPPQNLWNYHESELEDNPGYKKIVVKIPTASSNCTKHTTKTFSILTCGNASGEIVPPYVVYRAQNLDDTWIVNGPAGTRYNCTESGRFNEAVIEDWFLNHMLPILNKQDGCKILIGKNIISYMTYNVISLCESHNIKFVSLPSNSTRLLQPLDVAYSRSLKTTWQDILLEWRETETGKKLKSLPKDCFPNLLKQLVDAMQEKVCDYVKSGFQDCGIVPLDRNVVLEKLQGNSGWSNQHLE